MFEYVIFFFFAAVAILFALVVITNRNPVVSALSLVVSFFALAVMYVLLDAPFLAALQVIVYAGAIMVLFVFAIMVLIPGKEETGPDPRRWTRLFALPVGGVLLALVGAVLVARRSTAPVSAVGGGVESLGRLLFTDYLFPFELTSVLLLAAMVGVILLARKRA